MKRATLASLLLTSLLAASASSEQPEITNGLVTVVPIEQDDAIIGFRIESEQLDDDLCPKITFGSLGNIVASQVTPSKGAGPKSLRFGPLKADPTPGLGAQSHVAVTLYDDDPFPEISFQLKLNRFDRDAWEEAFGEVPFHFLCCSVPGAPIFHQRGWPIPTPVIDQYPQMQAEGPGKTVVSDWSRDWMYAPPIGAYPLPTVGLWKPEDGLYVGYDFHGPRLTDNSEKLVASSYCWKLRESEQFFTLVYPYAEGYNRLRYPTGNESFGTRFRLLYSTSVSSDDDPNRFVMEWAWKTYADLLPDAPTVVDVSWYPDQLRLSDFPEPRLGRLYGIAGEDARWEEPGAITAGGVGYVASAIDYAYEQGDQAAIGQLLADIDFLLPYTVEQEIGGDACAFWVKPVEGEMARMFGPGVQTIHNVQGWSVAQALLETYRNDREGQARLLPYIDGALRYTKHILYTRNGYPDVPPAQFAWGAGPVAHYCLSYYYTFRDDSERAELCELALKLARNMTYRYLAIWTSDNDQTDDLDAAYLMEPNAGLPWLGAACANEIWVVCHALAEVYVATGDPILAQYLLGMLERWPILARDVYFPAIGQYGDEWTERYGLFEGGAQAEGTRASYGGIWGGFEQLSWPAGGADVRVLCGEGSALVFNQGGVHTDIERYTAGPDGFAFRLKGAGSSRHVGAGTPPTVDVVVTALFSDLRRMPLGRLRGAESTLLREGEDYEHFAHRPDSLLVRGLAIGDRLSIGDPSTGEAARRKITKPRSIAESPQAESGGFTTVHLAPHADAEVVRDWEDPSSVAGLPGGRRILYGIPFDFVDPDVNGGRAAARREAIPVGQSGRTLFILGRAAGESPAVRVTFAGGRERTLDPGEGIPVLRGWPPLFEWELNLLQVPMDGVVDSVTPEDAEVFAVTVATAAADLGETNAALRERERELAARARTIAGLMELRPLLEYFAGHIAVLPTAGPTSSRQSPLAKLVHEAGIRDVLTFLSPEEVVDPKRFNAREIWITLYLGGEEYERTVNEDGDVIQAIRRYLGEGGTLVALPNQPFPFYYADGEPNVAAADVGLPICGSGAGDRSDVSREARRMNIEGWEAPPEEKRLTFQLNDDQAIMTSLPAKFPFPEEGDPRWRPIADLLGEGNVYTPILTLTDEDGETYGEGAAMIEYDEGDLAGGRVLYVWSTLVHSDEYQAAIVTDLLRYLLGSTIPPPAEALCYRAVSPVAVDGRLDEAAWKGVAPLGRFSCFGTKRGHPEYETRAKALWDDQNLYVAFEAEDPDAWSELTERDGPLWEGEVLEVYCDPDGDGRDYLEFEVSPLNTVIDLKIEREDNGAVADWQGFARWNADGWKTAVSVEGDVEDRAGTDRRWTVEMAIPLSNFASIGGPSPAVGDTWRLQLYRIDRSNTLEEPEYSGWSPTDTFHRPAQFGHLTFAGPPSGDDFSMYEPGSSGQPAWHIEGGEWQVMDGAFQRC